MHFNRLRALVAVIDHGSFSQAARSLGMSQPAVSQQIKALERALGTTLVERHGEPLRPTPAGHIAYRHARSILALWGELEEQIRELQEGAAGRLVLGASTVPATYILPALIGRFRERYPHVDVAMEVAASDTVRDWVLSGQVDMGAVGSRKEDDHLVHVPLGDDELLLIAPCNHPWTRRAPVSPRDLVDQPFVARVPASGTRSAAEAALRSWGIDPASLHVAIELGTTEAVVGAVEAGLGVSFVSRLAVQPALALGRVCTVPLDAPPIRRRFYLIYQRSREGNPLLRRFLQLLDAAGPFSGVASTGAV